MVDSVDGRVVWAGDLPVESSRVRERIGAMLRKVQRIGGDSSSGVGMRAGGRRAITALMAVWVVAGVSLVGFVASEKSGDDLVITFFETSRGDMIFIDTPS